MRCALSEDPPPRGRCGETKFGFTIGERVEVTDDPNFQGWFGHIRCFNTLRIGVDLDEPPLTLSNNGQWFEPERLTKAPK